MPAIAESAAPAVPRRRTSNPYQNSAFSKLLVELRDEYGFSNNDISKFIGERSGWLPHVNTVWSWAEGLALPQGGDRALMKQLTSILEAMKETGQRHEEGAQIPAEELATKIEAWRTLFGDISLSRLARIANVPKSTMVRWAGGNFGANRLRVNEAEQKINEFAKTMG